MFFGDQIGKRKRNTFYSLYCVLKHDFLFLILLLIILLVFFFLGSAVKRELRWVIPRKAAVQVKAYPACGIPN